MAKLFEEVLGNGPLATADIIIHFGPGGDHPPALLATPPVASPSNAHGHGTTSPIGAQTSPRPVLASPASPHRTTRSGWCHAGGNDSSGQSLRCHSMLLRTQPVLLEKLTAECRWTPDLSFAPETRAHHGYPSAEPREPPPAPAAAAAAAEAAAAAAWPAREEEPVEHLPDQVSAETSSARGQSEAEPMNSPRTQPTAPVSEKPLEVTVDDDAEVFLEMIRFIYLNNCHVDQHNVKALMHIADKYCIEDIVKHCLQWMQDNFTVGLFYHLLTVQMSHEHFGRLLWNSLLKALRSRRHFALVTADAEEHFEKLPVSFVEALLRSDELPVISEIEVIHLIARWARGALARQEKRSHDEDMERNSQSHEDVHETRSCEEEGHDHEAPDSLSDLGITQLAPALSDEMGLTTETCSSADADEETHKEDFKAIASRTRGDMLRLLGAVRKSNTLVRLADMEPMFQILGLNRLFCNKPPRETSALDPGFVIYRGVAGVNTPSGVFGDHSNMVPHAWKGVSVSLGSHDFMQQQEGFKPNTVPEGTSVFPRLWVRITCSSWSHREKRPSKSTAGHSRHSGPLGPGSQIPDTSSWESAPTHLMGMMAVNEEPASKFPGTLKSMQSQDDWEIGRTKTLRPTNTGCFPDLINNEKIEHKVVCAVISGQMRHGIRIGQRERSSIYDIEELYGQTEEVCLGGSPTEVEFELQLKVQAPSPCGICRCGLAVLQPESANPPLEQSEALMEVSFDASAEEPLHFYISSSYFDSNSIYTVALNWVLRPGLRLESDMDSDNVSPN